MSPPPIPIPYTRVQGYLNFINETSIPSSDLAFFTRHPSIHRQYLSSPKYHPIPYLSRYEKKDTSDRFMSRIVHTAHTIPYLLALARVHHDDTTTTAIAIARTETGTGTETTADDPLITESESEKMKTKIKNNNNNNNNQLPKSQNGGGGGGGGGEGIESTLLNWAARANLALTETRTPTTHPDDPDFVVLLQLESCMTGFRDTVHGGVLAALLDEALGTCLEGFKQSVRPRDGGEMRAYTANLDVSYRAPVECPGLVVIKTWLVRREGRKWFLEGVVEGLDGKVRTLVKGLWVSEKGKL